MKEESKDELKEGVVTTTYKIYVFCNNCYFAEKIEIPKGTLVERVSCPNCGNMTINQDPNWQIRHRPPQKPDYI